jgi:ABC-2 type transport system permease protein
MLDVFNLQWKRLAKQPFFVLVFLGLTIVFVYFLSGTFGGQSSISVPVYTTELSEEEASVWMDRLNDESTISFEMVDADRAEENVRMNRDAFAVELIEDNYQLLIGRESEELSVIQQHLYQVYEETYRLESIESVSDQDLSLTNFIQVDVRSLAASEEGVTDSGQSYVIFGMSFYFVMFSIMFLMMNLMEEKSSGTWNRMIFSPLSKIRIYIGHLLHYYLVGCLQVLLSFVILTNLLSVDFGDNYLSMIVLTLAFLFSIVSLGILVISLAKNAQSLQVVIPLISTAMAMIGGAFWPLEIVSNQFLLTIAEFIPLKHAVQGMLDAVYFDASLVDLLYPIGALLLMGVLFMGIGLNRLERPAEA